MTLALTWVTVVLLILAGILEFACSRSPDREIGMRGPRRIMAVACVLLTMRLLTVLASGETERLSAIGQFCLALMALSRILACVYVLFPVEVAFNRRSADLLVEVAVKVQRVV